MLILHSRDSTGSDSLAVSRVVSHIRPQPLHQRRLVIIDQHFHLRQSSVVGETKEQRYDTIRDCVLTCLFVCLFYFINPHSEGGSQFHTKQTQFKNRVPKSWHKSA